MPCSDAGGKGVSVCPSPTREARGLAFAPLRRGRQENLPLSDAGGTGLAFAAPKGKARAGLPHALRRLIIRGKAAAFGKMQMENAS